MPRCCLQMKNTTLVGSELDNVNILTVTIIKATLYYFVGYTKATNDAAN